MLLLFFRFFFRSIDECKIDLDNVTQLLITSKDPFFFVFSFEFDSN